MAAIFISFNNINEKHMMKVFWIIIAWTKNNTENEFQIFQIKFKYSHIEDVKNIWNNLLRVYRLCWEKYWDWLKDRWWKKGKWWETLNG